MNNNLFKPVYIPSIEASDIYSYAVRDKEIDLNYVGMIPTSLELNKLISIGLKTHKAKTSDKLLSDDVINVKFRQKVRAGEEIIKRTQKKMAGAKAEYKQKLINLIGMIEQEKDLGKWHEVNCDELRKHLYVNGFDLNGNHYVVYKRSSAKSRVGQCLFIKEHLYNEMINWSRMNLPLDGAKIDYPSLLAYESLVGSSIEGIIKIHPENILIIDDAESKFKQTCNVVRTGDDGYLDSMMEEVEISNSLFDGQSLLDSSYFHADKAMMLLRNHMFKSAAFNTNIQLYLKDHCPSDVNFDEWKIKNMYGQEMFAKDIHLIITPSSLKALKFAHVIGSELNMWEYWKRVIKSDGSLFGVCKSEKPSKRGIDDDGNVLQQLSYQMIDCLPMTKEDISELTTFEREFIQKLKNDDNFFIEFVENNANEINSNAMFVDLYKRNNKIVRTPLFRSFRASQINVYKDHVSSGKIRLCGDYAVMLGNPMEYLAYSIGKHNETNMTLAKNEIYTTLFDFDKELVGFRNPNTSPSNVLIVKNTYRADIERYLNLTDNIVCVNAIGFPLQDILSGSDYDSDTVLIVDNNKMLELGKKCFGIYRVCINKVGSSKRQYELSKADMAVIDNQLATSQKNIGRVVNLGQLCMSTYWDLLSKGKNEDELSELLKQIDVMTVLSGICIDLAKKMYEIDIDIEIRRVDKTEELRSEKPLFWRYVSEGDKVKSVSYNCPMDYLFAEMSGLKYADQKDNLNLKDLLVKQNVKKGNRHQESDIIKYVEDMCDKINHINGISNIDEEEKNEALDQVIKYCEFYVSKRDVKPETMYAILLKIQDKKSKIATKLMNVLYKTHKTNFLNAFAETKKFTLLRKKEGETIDKSIGFVI